MTILHKDSRVDLSLSRSLQSRIRVCACGCVYREKDLDQVLQTPSIFTNVSKGQLAKRADIVAAFGELADDTQQVCKEILLRGELQVSELERQAELDQLLKDIVNSVHEKCVHRDTLRPISTSTLERCLRDIHFAVKANRSAKQQVWHTYSPLSSFFVIRPSIRFVTVV